MPNNEASLARSESTPELLQQKTLLLWTLTRKNQTDIKLLNTYLFYSFLMGVINTVIINQDVLAHWLGMQEEAPQNQNSFKSIFSAIVLTLMPPLLILMTELVAVNTAFLSKDKIKKTLKSIKAEEQYSTEIISFLQEAESMDSLSRVMPVLHLFTTYLFYSSLYDFSAPIANIVSNIYNLNRRQKNILEYSVILPALKVFIYIIFNGSDENLKDIKSPSWLVKMIRLQIGDKNIERIRKEIDFLYSKYKSRNNTLFNLLFNLFVVFDPFNILIIAANIVTAFRSGRGMLSNFSGKPNIHQFFLLTPEEKDCSIKLLQFTVDEQLKTVKENTRQRNINLFTCKHLEQFFGVRSINYLLEFSAIKSDVITLASGQEVTAVFENAFVEYFERVETFATGDDQLLVLFEEPCKSDLNEVLNKINAVLGEIQKRNMLLYYLNQLLTEFEDLYWVHGDSDEDCFSFYLYLSAEKVQHNDRIIQNLDKLFEYIGLSSIPSITVSHDKSELFLIVSKSVDVDKLIWALKKVKEPKQSSVLQTHSERGIKHVSRRVNIKNLPKPESPPPPAATNIAKTITFTRPDGKSIIYDPRNKSNKIVDLGENRYGLFHDPAKNLTRAQYKKFAAILNLGRWARAEDQQGVANDGSELPKLKALGYHGDERIRSYRAAGTDGRSVLYIFDGRNYFLHTAQERQAEPNWAPSSSVPTQGKAPPGPTKTSKSLNSPQGK